MLGLSCLCKTFRNSKQTKTTDILNIIKYLCYAICKLNINGRTFCEYFFTYLTFSKNCNQILFSVPHRYIIIEDAAKKNLNGTVIKTLPHHRTGWWPPPSSLMAVENWSTNKTNSPQVDKYFSNCRFRLDTILNDSFRSRLNL